MFDIKTPSEITYICKCSGEYILYGYSVVPDVVSEIRALKLTHYSQTVSALFSKCASGLVNFIYSYRQAAIYSQLSLAESRRLAGD